jgi:hypothetical protein
MTQNFWFHPDPKAVRDICDQQKRFIIVLDCLLSTLWVEETYLLSSYTKSRAENQVRVCNSNNFLRIRNTSHCYLDGMLLEGGDDEQDPVVCVEGLGEQLLGLLGRVVHVQVLLEKELCYFCKHFWSLL